MTDVLPTTQPPGTLRLPAPPSRAAHLLAPPSSLLVVTGRDALALVHDDAFGLGWDYLAASCPWATATTSRAFVSAWFAAHADVAEPVLAVRGDGRRVAGLLPLARRLGTSDLVPAGGATLDLCGWLALPGEGDAFALAALGALADAFPLAVVHLPRLGPGTPVDWTLRGRLRLRTWSTRRALLDAPPGRDAFAWRRKSGNASKLARLAREGPVRWTRVTGSSAVESLLEEIEPWTLLRRAARGEDPGADDGARRRPFLADVADRGDLLHASALVAGGRIVAAHVGVRDGTVLRLRTLAHDPRLGRVSPGKLLLRMLAERLEGEGFTALDLATDAPWTARFATRSEEVAGVRVALSSTAATMDTTRGTARAAAGAAASAACAGRRAAAGVVATAARAVRGIGGPREVLGYAIRAARIACAPPSDTVAADRVEDLLAGRSFDADLAGDERRLARGERPFTAVVDGRLVACVWLVPRPARGAAVATAHGAKLPADAVLVSAIDVASGPAGTAAGVRALRGALHRAVADHGATEVWTFVDARDAARRRVVEGTGFDHRTTSAESTRRGRTVRTFADLGR